MTHQLILEVPNEIYDPLAETAKSKGATPEHLALDWLAAMSYHASRDPMEKFIGSMPGDTPDWADQHDKYLGDELLKTHDETNSGS